jgi:hypothetical protein
MKRVIHRIQALGEKAAQIRTAVESAPAVASSIRDAVSVTAGQLQQLRADVQAGVSGLRVEDEDRLLAALREISDSTDVLGQAGFGLAGVDVELGLLRRVVVRLQKLEDVSLSRLRSLHGSSAGKFAVQALLNALIKAEEMADKVDLPDLTYRELIVDVGPAPTVRVCWRSDLVVVDAEPIAPASRPSTAAPASAPPVLPPPSSILGKGSFFEPRTPSAAPAHPAAETSVPAAVGVPPATPVSGYPLQTDAVAVPSQPTAGIAGTKEAGDWRRAALDRFKRMPDFSKPRH